MKSDTGVALSFAVGLAFLTPAVEGQVFKCKGEDGKVTYTDVPCLRSETTSFVDTRSNVADHSSLRREATRLQRSEVTTAPQGQPQAASPTPSPPAPAAASERRPSGYSR
jgi:hypothetical protein